MQDRVPTKPNRALVRPEDGGAAFYATITRADEPTQVGDPLNKSTLLQDDTAALFGLDQTAVPNDLFKILAATSSTDELVFEFITSSQDWVAPKARLQKFVVFAVGGGGGGDADWAPTDTSATAGGGGSGHISFGTFNIAEGETVSIVCGAGGVGGFAKKPLSTAEVNEVGTSGGTTEFGDMLTASGGAYGTSKGGAGGAGGGGTSGGNGSFGGGGGALSSNGGNGGKYGGGGSSVSGTGGTGGEFGGNAGKKGTDVALHRAVLYLIPLMQGLSSTILNQTAAGNGGGGGYGGDGGTTDATAGGGGGGGFFGTGGTKLGGGGGFFGNGGTGSHNSNGNKRGGGGGGGFCCPGGPGSTSNVLCVGGGGGGFCDSGSSGTINASETSPSATGGTGGNGGVLIIYYNPVEGELL